MHIPSSLRASVTIILFVSFTDGLIFIRKATTTAVNGYGHESAKIIRDALRGGDIAKRDDNVTLLNCPNDRFEQMLDNNPSERVKTFCNEWLGIPPATITVEVTPTR